MSPRTAVAGVTAVLLVVAWCYLPTGLKPEGGGWYTRFTSHFPESGGNIALYRSGPLGIKLRVDDRAYVVRVYPPDCILYEPGREPGLILAACGNRRQVPVAFYAPSRLRGQFEADSAGLHRTDSVRVVGGRAMARMEHVRTSEILRAAQSQPLRFPGWKPGAESLPLVQPVIQDEPVNVHSRGPGGSTPLIDAVGEGQLDVVDALLRQGADVNAANSLGTTALVKAVMVFAPDTAVVRRLLDAGADKNAADHTGLTPLMWAAMTKRTPIFRQLLARGADPCRRDETGKTILDLTEGPFPQLQQLARAASARCRNN